MAASASSAVRPLTRPSSATRASIQPGSLSRCSRPVSRPALSVPRNSCHRSSDDMAAMLSRVVDHTHASNGEFPARSLRLVQERALPAELLAEFLDVECAGCETSAGREAGGGSCRLPGHPALRDLAHEGLGGGVAGHVAAADDHAVE